MEKKPVSTDRKATVNLRKVLLLPEGRIVLAGTAFPMKLKERLSATFPEESRISGQISNQLTHIDEKQSIFC